MTKSFVQRYRELIEDSELGRGSGRRRRRRRRQTQEDESLYGQAYEVGSDLASLIFAALGVRRR